MPETINLAFVGSGHWARRYHFPALAHLRAEGAPLHLRGITSLDKEQAARVAEHYGFERVYPNLDALMEDEALDAVAVAITPAALHDVMARLVHLGLPLFSEKPPGISAAQARSLSEIVTVPNVLAFNRRYIPLNNTFKEQVEAMEDLYFMEGHFLRHGREDETFMIGTGIHWINYLTYLFGEIEHVGTTRYRNPINDTWVWVGDLTFTSGLQGLLKVFPCTGSQHERLEVHSNTRSAYLHGPLWERPGRIVIEEGSNRRIIAPETDNPQPEIIRLGIVGEYQEFLDVVRHRTPSRSTFQNAVNAMEVAEAMEEGFDL